MWKIIPVRSLRIFGFVSFVIQSQAALINKSKQMNRVIVIE